MDADAFWQEAVIHDEAACHLMEQMFGLSDLADADRDKAAELEKKRALAEIGMVNWTQLQRADWVVLLGLPPDAEDVVESFLVGLSGAELAQLSDPNRLCKQLRKLGRSASAPQGGWGDVANCILKARDEMLYLSEHLEEFASKEGVSSDDLTKMFDQLVANMDEKDVSAAWRMGAIPVVLVASIWGLASKWTKRAQVGGKFALAREQRKKDEEAQMQGLISTPMEQWSREQVLEWSGLISLKMSDIDLVRGAFVAGSFDGQMLKGFQQTDQLTALLHQQGAQGLSALSLAEHVLEKRDEVIGARQKLISVGMETDPPPGKAKDFKAAFYRAIGGRFGEQRRPER